MCISFEELKKSYSEMKLEELLKLKDMGLTEIAKKALLLEFKERGITDVKIYNKNDKIKYACETADFFTLINFIIFKNEKYFEIAREELLNRGFLIEEKFDNILLNNFDKFTSEDLVLIIDRNQKADIFDIKTINLIKDELINRKEIRFKLNKKSFFIFKCPKCDSYEYTQTDVRMVSGFTGQLWDAQTERFSALSCVNCGYSELYREKSNLFINIIDYS